MATTRTQGSIPRPVWFLGWASLLTDAAGEMIYPLLPVYLARVLGAGALSLGVIEGVAEAVNSFLKVLSGRWSDRRSRRRPLVIAGYGLSSLARPLVALATSWPYVLIVRSLDRTGKGIRSAPRDAMLARMADASDRGRIFGFHRAMDHTGAILGPVMATVILFLAPDRYRLLFALAAIPGALAVAALFLVDESDGTPDAARVIATPVQPHATTTVASGDAMPAPLRWFLIVVLVFGLGSSADAFLLLRLSDALGSATWVPLIWAALHVVKASLSTWGGSLSDRWGRRRVIVAGWAVYALVYLGFAMATTAVAFIAWFLVYGLYFALTEGAEKALVADLAPSHVRGTAFGYYNAAVGVSALLASIVFGVLYEKVSPGVAFGSGAAVSALAVIGLLVLPPFEAPARTS